MLSKSPLRMQGRPVQPTYMLRTLASTPSERWPFKLTARDQTLKTGLINSILLNLNERPPNLLMEATTRPIPWVALSKSLRWTKNCTSQVLLD